MKLKLGLTTTLLCAIILFVTCNKSKEVDVKNGFINTPRTIKVVRTISKVNDLLSGDRSSNRRPGEDSDVPVIKDTYVPPEGHIEIISKVPGKEVEDLIEIRVKNKGFTKKFGVFAGASNSPVMGSSVFVGGLDVKLYYWNRIGFGTGIGCGPSFNCDGDLFASYRMDRLAFIDNTELRYSYSPISRRHTVGFRINL